MADPLNVIPTYKKNVELELNPGKEITHLVVYLINDLMVCFQLKQVDLEIG